MLNWIAIWVGVFLFGLGGPLQNDTQPFVPVSNDVARRGEAEGLLGRSAPAGAPRRLLRRARRARRLLDHAQPDDARLRGARGRLQPRGGALRRHLGRAQLLPRDGDLRARSPGSPARSTSSAGSSGSTRTTCSLVARSRSPASRSRSSGATRRSASGSRRSSSPGSSTGTSTRNLDPEIFRPELASNLTLLIQGLVVLFVGADVLILSVLGLRKRRRRRVVDGNASDRTAARAAAPRRPRRRVARDPRRHRRLLGRAAAAEDPQAGRAGRDRPGRDRARDRRAQPRRAAARLGGGGRSACSGSCSATSPPARASATSTRSSSGRR